MFTTVDSETVEMFTTVDTEAVEMFTCLMCDSVWFVPATLAATAKFSTGQRQSRCLEVRAALVVLARRLVTACMQWLWDRVD